MHELPITDGHTAIVFVREGAALVGAPGVEKKIAPQARDSKEYQYDSDSPHTRPPHSLSWFHPRLHTRIHIRSSAPPASRGRLRRSIRLVIVLAL